VYLKVGGGDVPGKGEDIHSTIPQLILREKARPTAHRYRQRLSAFLNHATGRGGSPRRQRAGRQSSGGGESEQRKLVIHHSSWTQADPEDKGEDARQTFTIVTETIGYILWHSVDYEKRQLPWRAWGVFLSSLDEFSGCHPLIMPVFSVKQRVFTLLMNALRLDAGEGEVERDPLLDVVLQLSLLFETFVISSCPRLPQDKDKEEVDMELLNLSFTITMDFNATNCSTELFQHYLFMLSAVGIFESQFHSTTEMELGRSIMRVLLAAISHSDKEVVR
jgi:hypothetical protein